MTDATIATRMRELAADLRDPLSVDCLSCGATAGGECVDTTGDMPPRGDGSHSSRRLNARLTADGRASKLLEELAKENA